MAILPHIWVAMRSSLRHARHFSCYCGLGLSLVPWSAASLGRVGTRRGAAGGLGVWTRHPHPRKGSVVPAPYGSTLSSAENIKQQLTWGRTIIFQIAHERNTRLLCSRLRGTACNTSPASYDIDSFLGLNLFTVMNVLLFPWRPQSFRSPLLINGL